MGPARQHDVKGWRKALQQACPGVLYLLDRGYCCFKLWWAIEDACSYTLRGQNWHIFKLLEFMDK